jgi:pimeloyl-ACP methyl ester carboxylesterase
MPAATAPDGARIDFERHDRSRARGSRVLVALAAMGTTARLYSEAIEYGLAAGYSVVIVEHRSARELGGRRWSTSLGADDVIAVLDHLGVRRAHLSGASLGGMVAQEVALRHPERTGALILAATTGGWPRIDLHSLPGLLALLRSSLRPRSVPRLDLRVERAKTVWFSKRFAAQTGPGSEAWNALAAILEAAPSHESRGAQLLAALRHSTWSRLSQISAPTLVQHGGADRVISPRAGRELARRIPGARFHLWPGAGHALGLEVPKQTYTLGLEFAERHDHLLEPDLRPRRAPLEAVR